jgi:hypothetical protein
VNIIRTGFVNTKGFALIKKWIESTTMIDDVGPYHSTDDRNLEAWAEDIERHLNCMGNGAWCEMSHHGTASGLTETLTLPDDCIDWREESLD